MGFGCQVIFRTQKTPKYISSQQVESNTYFMSPTLLLQQQPSDADSIVDLKNKSSSSSTARFQIFSNADEDYASAESIETVDSFKTSSSKFSSSGVGVIASLTSYVASLVDSGKRGVSFEELEEEGQGEEGQGEESQGEEGQKLRQESLERTVVNNSVDIYEKSEVKKNTAMLSSGIVPNLQNHPSSQHSPKKTGGNMGGFRRASDSEEEEEERERERDREAEVGQRHMSDLQLQPIGVVSVDPQIHPLTNYIQASLCSAYDEFCSKNSVESSFEPHQSDRQSPFTVEEDENEQNKTLLSSSFIKKLYSLKNVSLVPNYAVIQQIASAKADTYSHVSKINNYNVNDASGPTHQVLMKRTYMYILTLVKGSLTSLVYSSPVLRASLKNLILALKQTESTLYTFPTLLRLSTKLGISHTALASLFAAVAGLGVWKSVLKQKRGFWLTDAVCVVPPLVGTLQHLEMNKSEDAAVLGSSSTFSKTDSLLVYCKFSVFFINLLSLSLLNPFFFSPFNLNFNFI
jgi:hypothetical protein